MNPALIEEFNKLFTNDVSKWMDFQRASELFPELEDVPNLGEVIKNVRLYTAARDLTGQNSLHIAVIRGDLAMLKLNILFKPWQLFEQTLEALTPLCLAASTGFTSAIEWLVNPEALYDQELTYPKVDINQKTANGRTALHRAIIAGHFETVEKLLSLGADKHVEDDLRLNAADWAYFESENSAKEQDVLRSQKFQNLMLRVLTTKPVLPYSLILKKLSNQ